MIFAVKLKGEPMTNREAINWIINISADIGKSEHRDLWHYEQALYEIRDMLEDVPDTNVGDTISRQAAIDACLKGKTDGLPATNVACDCCAERIRVLPSASPEQTHMVINKSKGGTTMWYQCAKCGEPSDLKDKYCRCCGRRFSNEDN